MAIESTLQAVDKLLLATTNSTVPVLSDTSSHILQAGGKRLRPRLVLLAYLAAGGQDIDYVIPLAAAVEIIHTATLVHDDINDHGTLRRGRETVNSRWQHRALLTGDFMFTKTYEIMAPYPGQLNAILAKAAIDLVEGETLQINAAKQGQLDRDTYYEIIAKKTASLFVACTKLGAVAANAPDEAVQALSTYAYNLGLAFQIIDDADLIADPKLLAKTWGSISRRDAVLRRYRIAQAITSQITTPLPSSRRGTQHSLRIPPLDRSRKVCWTVRLMVRPWPSLSPRDAKKRTN
jgi:geranylgeranyl pyrophosphate synthase